MLNCNLWFVFIQTVLRDLCEYRLIATNVVFKFQTGKYDKLNLGSFSEKITSKIKLTSKKIAFRNTLITGIETSLSEEGGGGNLTEIRMT